MSGTYNQPVTLRAACVERIKHLLGRDHITRLVELHTHQKVIDILTGNVDAFGCCECLTFSRKLSLLPLETREIIETLKFITLSEFKMTTAPAKTFHDNLCQILMNDNQLRDFAFHSTMVSSDYQVITIFATHPSQSRQKILQFNWYKSGLEPSTVRKCLLFVRKTLAETFYFNRYKMKSLKQTCVVAIRKTLADRCWCHNLHELLGVPHEIVNQIRLVQPRVCFYCKQYISTKLFTTLSQ